MINKTTSIYKESGEDLTKWEDVTNEFVLNYTGEFISYGNILYNASRNELKFNLKIDLPSALNISSYNCINHNNILTVPYRFTLKEVLFNLTCCHEYGSPGNPLPGYTFVWTQPKKLNVQFVSCKNSSMNIGAYDICGLLPLV